MLDLKNEKFKKSDLDTEIQGVLIKLLQGFVHHDDKKYWNKLITHQEYVKDYVSKLGLYLHLSIDEGYAFLKSTSSKEDEEEILDDGSPLVNDSKDDSCLSLVRKMPLSFEVSLLCVLLREALELYDEKVNDDYRLVLQKVDIYDLLKTFYPERHDETKLVKKFDSLINKVIELGFLKELKNISISTQQSLANIQAYEVKRVIKALIDANKLKDIKNSMLDSLNENSSLSAEERKLQ